MKKSPAIKKQVYEYVAIFEPDQKAGGFTVYIPDLPGCVTEGDTFEKALANIREAADLYLEEMRLEKKRIPPASKRPLLVPVRVLA